MIIKGKLFLNFVLLFGINCNFVFSKVSDSNLGWPNFFNPKQSILRENEDKDTRKIEEKYKIKNFEDIEGLQDEDRFSTEEEIDIEELMDYTIKGGLRGTYVLLNSSANIDNLNEDAKETINKILRVDNNLFNRIDETLAKGETTEEGVKLRMPMVLKTHSKTLGKYGSRLTFFSGEEATHMIHFGNWCGRGGRSAPVDNIDGCCLEQEKCYGKLVRHCPDVWTKPYRRMYAWLFMNDQPVCVRSDATCINKVCECDREASLCLSHFTQNPTEIPLHVDPTPVFSNRMEKKKRK